MKINPTKLNWKAPTTNVDGTPIDYALEYEVGMVGAEGVISPLMVVPSQLQTDAGYEAPITELGLDVGRTYEIALRSFAKEQPSRKSVWSDTVEFAMSNRIPSPPLSVTVY
jgi:hypothetical protein